MVVKMAKDLHSKSNERGSSQFSQNLDSRRIDSLLAGLQKKPSSTIGSRLKSRSDSFLLDTTASRKRRSELSDLLTQLKNREITRPEPLTLPNPDEFLKSIEGDVFKNCEISEEDQVQ